MNIFENCKILIVDDRKENIDVLVNVLRRDFKLSVALNGKKALEILKHGRIDLVLLDISMPEMDGFEVCRKIKEDKKLSFIPVIFITAMHDNKFKSKGFKSGAVDYITKPFDSSEVKARVETHLSLMLAQEALRNQNKILDQRVMERTKKLQESQVEIIQRLGLAAEFRDKDTGIHVKRMSRFCRILGKAVGMSREDYETLSLASTLHDIGKIGISDTILLKQGKLTKQQYEVIKTHAPIGAKMLAGSKLKIIQVAEIIARTHHEKWDGSGYPMGLSGVDIPFEGRISCICDVFDALISERPYKNAWPFERALGELVKSKNSYFDPQLVDTFISHKEFFLKVVNELV